MSDKEIIKVHLRIRLNSILGLNCYVYTLLYGILYWMSNYEINHKKISIVSDSGYKTD
ncbi:MAG: hypothetical protein ACTHKC_08205 [Candidatus Nitrosocosmicus sp.]